MSLQVGMSIEGAAVVAERLRAFSIATVAATKLAVKAVCDDLWAATQEEVPVDTGLLKSTGRSRILDKESTPVSVVGEVSYNNDPDDKAWYAVIVHEKREYQHDFPTKYKYVEDPLMYGLSTGRYPTIFANTLMQVLISKLPFMANPTFSP